MLVTKASGKKEPFSLAKIRRTCRRAGADTGLTRRVLEQVKQKIFDGISTREILRLVLSILDKESISVAARYNLKEAIMRLGPSGFVFEKLIAEILREYNYQTEMPLVCFGRCVDHEVDIVASKKSRCFMVECKYRNASGIYIGIKEILYTWARFLDLVDGAKAGKCPRFDQPWLISNTKFSQDAIKYSQCQKMALTGWKYPPDASLKEMLERKLLYPVTVLRKIDKQSLASLAQANLMLCRDLVKKDLKELLRLTGLGRKKLNKIRAEAEKLLT